jgi:hypothetical protein
MALTLTTDERAALEARERIVREAVKFELDSGTFGLWNGLGSITVDSVTYEGVGQMGQASQIVQSGNLVPAGVELRLNGLDQRSGFTEGGLWTDLEDEDVHGRAVTMYRWYFDNTKRTNVAANLKLSRQTFKGFIDRIKREEQVAKGGGLSETLVAYLESTLMEINRRHVTRRTNEHQQQLFSGDDFFEFVPYMPTREIFWGRGGTVAGGGGGGGSSPGSTDRPPRNLL